ncbi:MAG: YhbY family RNA-binding protein [Oscillospiraceae bacterium]|nr:YhbY family RNA-binding protein [Oscillospiraceae bacterium]
MTSKERAALRAQANKLEVLFQYGKGGLSDALIEATDGALNTRELIKLKVLVETSPDTPRQAADKLSEATGADVVQVIGGVIVLYRYNPELHKKAEKKPEMKKRVSRFEEKPVVKSKKTSKMEKQRRLAAAAKRARNADN